MRKEARMTINGTQLTDAQSKLMRIAVEAFATLLAEKIEGEDEEIARARDERFAEPMMVIQKLLYSDQTRQQ